MNTKHTKLGQFASTAICGNDITSSVLYVSGIAIGVVGVYAPIILLIIGVVLLLYKGVYREVVEALPVNGGAYNALLNGTSKKVAATAGVLTTLSYIATCVISGQSAVQYLFHTISEHFPSLQGFFSSGSTIIFITIGVLAMFAILVIAGVKDSAKVAIGIFSLHLATLTLFVLLAIIYILHQGSVFDPSSVFRLNIDFTHTLEGKSIFLMLFLGFASSLLGVSGFESSANFVEEQQKGVFKKTLRNMLLAVVIFNPLIAFLALNINSVEFISANKDYLLATQAQIIGGDFFQWFVAIDAFLVLCGAVLTSFIGVSGLINRMSLDEVLPLWLSKENSKGSFPRIIVGFFLFCVSILILTNGELSSLAGVYAISFLSVMSMFAIGNIILKITRPDLKRYHKTPIMFVAIAFTATFGGVIGNIVINPDTNKVAASLTECKNLIFFLIYFIPVYGFVRLFLYRKYVIIFFERFTRDKSSIHAFFSSLKSKTNEGKYILFIHSPNRLFENLRYITANELGRNIILLHCKDNTDEINKEAWKDLKTLVPIIPKAGVFPHLHLDLEEIDGKFGPDLVTQASEKYCVPKNKIFIGAIHHFHQFDYDELGGVRIIA